jgi:hypothetical protein
MDDCARLFSASFYKNLLEGKNIINAYNNAKKVISNSDDKDIDFNVCCCAHDHDENCKWFKLYKTN